MRMIEAVEWAEMSAKCREMHSRGFSTDEIGSKLNIEGSTVRKLLKFATADKCKGKEAERFDRDEKIIKLRKEGMNYKQIAAAVGVSLSIVKYVAVGIPKGGKKAKPKSLTINQINRRALALGMSYGQYVGSKQYEHDICSGVYEDEVWKND